MSLPHPTALTVSTLFMLSLVAALVVPEPVSALTGRELMKKVREKNSSRTQLTQIKMTLVDKKGRTQERAVKIYAEQVGDVENSLLRFMAPKRIKGISFLVINEDEASKRYLYLPRQKKTRLVPEGDNHKSFQGTDFTYYDLSPHDVDTDNYEPLTSDHYDGHDIWVCTTLPKPGTGSPYGKIVQWIRKDIYVPVKIDFYDEKGKLLKVSRATQLKKIDTYWTPIVTEMHNVQIDHKTVMTIEVIKYDVDIPAKVFSKSNLEQGG